MKRLLPSSIVLLFLIACTPAVPSEEEGCSETFQPVCAKVDVVCITAPCPPLEQTFFNRCIAEQEGAYDLVEGECVSQVLDPSEEDLEHPEE